MDRRFTSLSVHDRRAVRLPVRTLHISAFCCRRWLECFCFFVISPLVEELHDWLMAQRTQMSRHNPVAKAINYMFEKEGRWEAFARFLDDGRLCLSNNAAERALRGIALGRRAWLADVLARLPGIPVSRLPELLPWNWTAASSARQVAA